MNANDILMRNGATAADWLGTACVATLGAARHLGDARTAENLTEALAHAQSSAAQLEQALSETQAVIAVLEGR